MSQAAQLALPFRHAADYGTQGYLRGPGNAAALAWLDRPDDWPDGRLIVWGEAGTGKTHLLHVWSARSGAALWAGPRLDWPAALADAAPLGVDDADSAPQDALLHLINAAAELRRPLLLTGRAPPARWPARRPDLSSRLLASASAELRGPGDEMLAALFARLLAERQLAVPDPWRRWLLRRLPRDPAALRRAAERLDQALLASGGRITRGLAASIVEPAS